MAGLGGFDAEENTHSSEPRDEEGPLLKAQLSEAAAQAIAVAMAAANDSAAAAAALAASRAAARPVIGHVAATKVVMPPAEEATEPSAFHMLSPVAASEPARPRSTPMPEVAARPARPAPEVLFASRSAAPRIRWGGIFAVCGAVALGMAGAWLVAGRIPATEAVAARVAKPRPPETPHIVASALPAPTAIPTSTPRRVAKTSGKHARSGI